MQTSLLLVVVMGWSPGAARAQAPAAESLRILQNRYEAGLATIADLLRAETAHSAAQKSFLNAAFDYRVSFAALELATGELRPDSQVCDAIAAAKHLRTPAVGRWGCALGAASG